MLCGRVFGVCLTAGMPSSNNSMTSLSALFANYKMLPRIKETEMRFILQRGCVDNDDDYDVMPKQRRHEEQLQNARNINIVDVFEDGNLDALKGSSGVSRNVN